MVFFSSASVVACLFALRGVGRLNLYSSYLSLCEIFALKGGVDTKLDPSYSSHSDLVHWH